VEATIRFVQAGTGLAPAPRIDTLGEPLAGASADLAALAAFLRTLRPPASPYATSEPQAISRGRDAFARFACATCHAGPAFTDRALHDVGTGDLATERNSHGRGTRFDTPSLRALWLTAPYLHDGSAPTLTVLFTRGAHDLSGQATAAEVADLVAYLRAL
jgi:cytochrome c peroxidase